MGVRSRQDPAVVSEYTVVHYYSLAPSQAATNRHCSFWLKYELPIPQFYRFKSRFRVGVRIRVRVRIRLGLGLGDQVYILE